MHKDYVYTEANEKKKKGIVNRTVYRSVQIAQTWTFCSNRFFKDIHFHYFRSNADSEML